MRQQDPNVQEGSTQHNLNQIKIAECRICLTIESIDVIHSKLISPCKCTGSLQFVHENCMKQWINKLVEKSGKKVKSGKAHILCQLCMSKIHFRASTSNKCKSKLEIKEYFFENIRTFVLLLLLFLANLGFISALLNSIIFMKIVNFNDNSMVLGSLIISGIAIFSIVAVATAVALILKFLLKKESNFQIVVGETSSNKKAITHQTSNEPKQQDY